MVERTAKLLTTMTESKSIRGLVRPAAQPNTFTFAPGQSFRHGTDLFSIARIEGPHYVLRHFISLQEKFVTFDQLLQEYLKGALTPTDSTNILLQTANSTADQGREIAPLIDDMSEAARRRARTVLRYVRELRSLNYDSLRPNPMLQLEFQRLQARLRAEDASLEPLSLSTVYKWSLKLDKAGGDPRAAYPAFSDRGAPHRRRISKIASQLLNTEFARIREDPKAKINYSEIELNLEGSLRAAIPVSEVVQHMPSRSTIERLTKSEFGAYVITARNKGSAYAARLYRNHYPRDRALRPLEVVEFDDKDTRTFVVDERTGLVCGRAFVTAGVDQFSTVPLGFSISDRYRSLISAMEAFRNSVIPSPEPNQSDFPDAHLAEFYGTPGIAIFDNALYNHATALEEAMAETVKCIVAWSKPYTPTEKSCIEDFNGRMGEHFAELPGHGGPKKSRDGLTEGLSTAVLTTRKFRENLLNWAYRGYCNTPRDGGSTPRQRWQTGTRYMKPRLPNNLDHFDIAFTLRHSVQLRPDGILFAGLPYQSDELKGMRRRIGYNATVEFRYHPYRLERIFVFDPIKKRYLSIPSAVPDYVRHLTLAQHRQIRKLARDKGKRNPSLPELFAYREDLRVYIQQLLTSKKRVDRKWASQVGAINETNISKVEKQDVVIENVSELEQKYDELGRVEIEASDEQWDLPEDF